MSRKQKFVKLCCVLLAVINSTGMALCSPKYKLVEKEPINQLEEAPVIEERNTFTAPTKAWEQEYANFCNSLASSLQGNGYNEAMSYKTMMELPTFYKQDFLIAYTWLKEEYQLDLSEVTYLSYTITPCYVSSSISSYRYANIEVHVKSGEELLNDYGIYGIPAQIKELLTNDFLGVDLSAIDITVSGKPIVDYVLSLEKEQSIVLQTALSLYYKIPYVYGNKPIESVNDYENSEEEPVNELELGLDCSGYVEWVFSTAGYTNTYDKLHSTSAIINNCTEITEKKICCVGIKSKDPTPGEINHTGIYVGDGYYIHCNATDNTVSITKFPFATNYLVSHELF